MDVFEKYPDLSSPEFIEAYDFSTCWSVQNPSGALSELDVCVALIKTDANISLAASILARSRRSLAGFVARDPAISSLVEDITEQFLDNVEAVYKVVALKGDGPAAKFFLSTKGKARGFSQRTELTGPDGKPIQTEDMTQRDADEFTRAIAGLAAPRTAPSKAE